MQTLDWLLVIVPSLIVIWIGCYTQRYMKSVADFMSGGRLAGPYLLAVAKGELQSGAVVFVAAFEIIAKSGFTMTWWAWITSPLYLVVAIFGFVIYRFRETRAMTLAQFFELRYSKRLRVFTGMLGFVAGLIYFGIIPAVGARCMVYFFGLPPVLQIGGFAVQTYILLMATFLVICLFLTLSGGHITLMVTDCLGGIISQIFYLVIIAALVSYFSWGQISDVFGNRAPGNSLLNPFDSSGIEDFNIWYILMTMFVTVYGTMAWQNASAYNSAAITPHAAVMGGILGRWREAGKGVVITLLGVCAVTFLHHPDFASQAASTHQAIAAISEPGIQKQMEASIAISNFLPVGVRGLLCVVLLMGIFGGDSTHLHSWGSIFVQDVLVPLRKQPFGKEQHVRVLRASIIGVALFAFVFGIAFPQFEYIVMWWSVTTGVYVGGAGAAIIGGLYWKKGTTAGAWAALITGSLLAGGGIIIRMIVGKEFPLNGMQISFFGSLIAIAVYVAVSLLTCREDFDMDRMLNRGKYASNRDAAGDVPEPRAKKKFEWGRLVGINKNFSKGDRIIAWSTLAWSSTWFCNFAVGSIWNLIAPWPEKVWSAYWHVVAISMPICLAGITAVWFTLGGVRDLQDLFRRLRTQRVNHFDDGTVVNHQNLDEVCLEDSSIETEVSGKQK